MANNRLLITCTVCGDELALAKYFPSDGWWTRDGALAEHLDAWFFAHEHDRVSTFGRFFTVGYEHDPPDDPEPKVPE